MIPVPPQGSAELAAWLGAAHEGPERVVRGLAPLESAGAEDLAYAERPGPTGAGVLLCRAAQPGATCLVVPDPKRAFIQVMERLLPEEHPRGVHPTAVIEGALGEGVAVGAHAVVEAGAVIGAGAVLYAGVVVGRGAQIGEGTVLFPKVVVYPGVVVGRACRVHAGAVLGADGFSYHPTPEGPLKVPQRGALVLEDGVEVGANTCIDRAFLGETRVGAGSKLDNLVQLGHNVQLGRACVLAAQVGVAGSTTFGDGVLVGGQAGFVEHLHVGAGARVAAGSGVIRDVPPGEVVLGAPALPAPQARRILAALRRLPDWMRGRG